MKKTMLLLSLMLFVVTAAGWTAYAKIDSKSSSKATVPSNKSGKKGDRVIRVYGPGGPLGPIQEAAEQFAAETGIKVEVTAGPEAKWIDKAKQDADVIFGGSEYMLQDFIFKHPNLVNPATRTELYSRAAGILVRKGNPKKIESLEDLTKKGVKIIDVNGAGQLGLWEDLAGRKGIIGDIHRNIRLSVKSSAEAIEKWKANAGYDAWITYESWHYRLKDVTDLVELPEEEKLYRGTPIALTKMTDQKKDAQRFIDFLKTEESYEIFQKWGWKQMPKATEPAPVNSLKLLKNEKVGAYLADSQGRALYYFKKDEAGKSNCSGDCLVTWPAFTQKGFAVPEGFDRKDFGTITRQDNGEKQVTYQGFPLYYFAKDQQAGDVNGQGVKDVWFVINSETQLK